MAKYTETDHVYPWRVANLPGVQAAVRKAAFEGVVKARAITMQHRDTGALLAGIKAVPDVVVHGKGVPIVDWLVTWNREDVVDIEFGGYSEKRKRHIKGLRFAHRTFRAMAGE